MGRVFLEHPGGTRVYCCANCDTALTNRTELVSTVKGRLCEKSQQCLHFSEIYRSHWTGFSLQ